MKTTLSESNLYKKRETCRVCKGHFLEQILSLGNTPPANGFLKKEDLEKEERAFPLNLFLCKTCGFVQLGDVVSPDLLFRNYPYVSSTSPSFVRHFEEFAETVCGRFFFSGYPLIVDIGSNDGILLKPFQKRGWRVLGVDPAVEIAERATNEGIPTLPFFFTEKVARDILREKGSVQIITATSAFPHIDDLDDMVSGVRTLLSDDGVFVVEAYALADLIRNNLFDTIYHEHLSYFTVRALDRLFARLGMELFDSEKVDTHGGSIRVFIQKNGGPYSRTARVAEEMQKEKEFALDQPETFHALHSSIEKNKESLRALLLDAKNHGKRIAGYGAAAKSTTFLCVFEIGKEILDYIVDDSPWKHGLYTPGTHIPVVSSEELEENPPDYILILAWNFSEQIMKKVSALPGGQHVKCIIPVPEPKTF